MLLPQHCAARNSIYFFPKHNLRIYVKSDRNNRLLSTISRQIIESDLEHSKSIWSLGSECLAQKIVCISINGFNISPSEKEYPAWIDASF